jgi:acetyl-CoA carboxylase biotin carboxyl carrier protein
LIVETLEASTWDQAVVVIGDVQIAVARDGAALPSVGGADGVAVSTTPAAIAVPAVSVVSTPAPSADQAPAPILPAAPASGGDGAVDGGHLISAPSVGVFWRASQPGAAPFVEVGSRVRAGDTLCIVEVMKLMSNVASDVDGVVTAILVENAGAVEYGTPLFRIARDA